MTTKDIWNEYEKIRESMTTADVPVYKSDRRYWIAQRVIKVKRRVYNWEVEILVEMTDRHVSTAFPEYTEG